MVNFILRLVQGPSTYVLTLLGLQNAAEENNKNNSFVRRRSTKLCLLHQEGAEPSLPLMVMVSNQYGMWISPSRVILNKPRKFTV